MFNVCYGCGRYNSDKLIQSNDADKDNTWAFAICPSCGYKHPFRKLPLFVVCGASGTGKTAVCSILARKKFPFIPLEGDILWCPAFDDPENNYRDFNEIWLRMAKNIGQAGRPVVLFSAGAGIPGNLQNCTERRYFSSLYVLALVCDKSTLKHRLQKRPAWRNCSESFISNQIEFNKWYRDVGPTLDPPITVIDTSQASLEQTVSSVMAWITPFLPKNQ